MSPGGTLAASMLVLLAEAGFTRAPVLIPGLSQYPQMLAKQRRVAITITWEHFLPSGLSSPVSKRSGRTRWSLSPPSPSM